jgi:hypothetical protein
MPQCPACPQPLPATATSCPSCGATFEAPVLALFESRLSKEQEAGVIVPAHVTVTIGVLAIAGGAWGAIAVAHQVATQPFRILTAGLFTFVAAFFLFGILSGVLALRRQEGWLWKNTLFWLAQVPVLQSTVLSYTLFSGAMLSLWVQPFEPRLGFNYWFGSSFQLNIGRATPLLFGVNVVALVITLYLLHLQRKRATWTSEDEFARRFESPHHPE